ncbi:MAG: endo-1,4-beta-xylanase [Halanaerobiales bacterium]
MSKVIPSLYETYKDYFAIGAAVNTPALSTHKELLKKHFNSITAENEMKPISLNPEKGKYTFEEADAMIEFAGTHNKLVRGHTLVWHNQTSDHVFTDENGDYVSPDTLIARLREYMSIVFDHFGDKVYCWDVLNEAIEDKQNKFYRDTKWLEILGEDYIDMIFSLARDLNSDTLLFYNDYNAVIPEKRDKIYKLLKGMKEKSIPLDGVGIQGHWNIHDFNFDDIKRAIEKYASLDLKIHITELDISMFSSKDKRTDVKEPTAEMIEKQNDFYENIFSIFREYHKVIGNVTLWGIADDYTWLDYFPVKDRKNWPLLFDENHSPKEAFWRVVEF